MRGGRELKTLTILAIVVFLGIGNGFAQDMQVLDQVKKEIMSLESGAGDVWDYSGSGGYVFRFSQDVLGDSTSEIFVNASVRPNVWHVFTGSDSKNYIGDIKISGSGFLLHRDDQSATLLDTYQADALEKYIIEQKITASGIQKSVRKVREDATEEEYQAILNRQTSNNTVWVSPKMEGILLYDLLNQPSPKWFDFNPDKTQVRNGYYRLPGDEGRISEFENVFTPKAALEALNQALGISQPVDKRTTATPSRPAETTLVQHPQSAASPSLTATQTKSALPDFPIVPVAIVGTVIVGIVFYLLRRKST